MKAIKCKHMILRPVCVNCRSFQANLLLCQLCLALHPADNAPRLSAKVKMILFHSSPEFAVTWEVTGLKLVAHRAAIVTISHPRKKTPWEDWPLSGSTSQTPVPCWLSAALCLQAFTLRHTQNPWRFIPLAAAQKESLLLGGVTGKLSSLLHHGCTGQLVLCARPCWCPVRHNKTKPFVLLLAVCQGNGFLG